MTDLNLHPATEAALRDLLFGVGFGGLAVASAAPQSPAFDALVVVASLVRCDRSAARRREEVEAFEDRMDRRFTSRFGTNPAMGHVIDLGSDAIGSLLLPLQRVIELSAHASK